eukprot:EG_transcript_17450
MYDEYLKWRSGPGAPANLARSAAVVPPEWLRRCGVAKDGTVAAYCQGARYDPAVDPEAYVQFCCHLIDQVATATDLNRVTIIIDTRGGPGWPNPSPKTMIGFFRLANQVLNANYPERAQRLIIYPIPSALVSMWSMCSLMLDSVTRKKFVMLSSDGRQCPPKVFDYIDPDQFPLDAQPLHHCPGFQSVPPGLAQRAEEGPAPPSGRTPSRDDSLGGIDALVQAPIRDEAKVPETTSSRRPGSVPLETTAQ